MLQDTKFINTNCISTDSNFFNFLKTLCKGIYFFFIYSYVQTMFGSFSNLKKKTKNILRKQLH
jgi:hypothetical protein